MDRGVVDDPEDTVGVVVRWLSHDAVDQTVEVDDAGLGHTGTKHLGTAHVPRG